MKLDKLNCTQLKIYNNQRWISSIMTRSTSNKTINNRKRKRKTENLWDTRRWTGWVWSLTNGIVWREGEGGREDEGEDEQKDEGEAWDGGGASMSGYDEWEQLGNNEDDGERDEEGEGAWVKGARGMSDGWTCIKERHVQTESMGNSNMKWTVIQNCMNRVMHMKEQLLVLKKQWTIFIPASYHLLLQAECGHFR